MICLDQEAQIERSGVEIATLMLAHLDECDKLGKFASIGTDHIRLVCQSLLTADREGWTRARNFFLALSADAIDNAGDESELRMARAFQSEVVAVVYTPPSHAGGASLQKPQTSEPAPIETCGLAYDEGKK